MKPALVCTADKGWHIQADENLCPYCAGYGYLKAWKAENPRDSQMVQCVCEGKSLTPDDVRQIRQLMDTIEKAGRR